MTEVTFHCLGVCGFHCTFCALTIMEDKVFFPVSARNVLVALSHKMSCRKNIFLSTENLYFIVNNCSPLWRPVQAIPDTLAAHNVTWPGSLCPQDTLASQS